MENDMTYLDGVELPVQTIITMAMNAPDHRIAEHYVVSLLSHASRHGDRELQIKCEEILDRFNVSLYPKMPASKGNMPNVRR